MSGLPNYQIMQMVGQGSFGTVYKAYDRTSKKLVAIKRLKKHTPRLSREFQILFQLKGSKYVVGIEDFFYSQAYDGNVTQNIVFQFVTSDLDKYIQKQKQTGNLIQKDRIIYQILKGLEFSHKQKIVHRDLKPQNILIDNEKNIKICDYGCAKKIQEGDPSITHIASQHYRAPQLILCISNYNSAVDIWAAGCILAELFLMRPLFEGCQDSDQLVQMFTIIGSFSDKEKLEFKKRTPVGKKVLKKITNTAIKIAKMEQIFWMVDDFKNFKDLLVSMLKYLPEERTSATVALRHPFFNSIRSQFEKNQK